MIVVSCFFVLLIIGVPVSIVILLSSIVGISIYSNIAFTIVPQQMFNGLGNFVLLAIPLFIMSGNIAAKGDIARRLVNLMRMTFSGIKGGSVIAGIVACSFFAAISGSSMATIVAIGGILMPALINMGYSRELAEGSVTAAGSIGILIPPSCSMIMICVAMNTSVGRQYLAGFIPGILLASVWSLYIYILCRKGNVQDVKEYSSEEKKKIWKESLLALLYPIIVLGSIYTGFATPTEAAAIAFVYVVIIEIFVFKIMSLGQIIEECKKALVSSGSIIIIISCAAVLNWLVTTQQIPANISMWITNHVTSKILFILIIGLIFFVSGCFMDLIALIIILGPILQPTLGVFEIDAIHFGIIAIMYTQMAYLTPPFGLNLYVTMGMQNRSLIQVSRAVMPFLVILLIMTIAFSFIPEISLFLPNLLMR
jgi:C4-dicarboxylate transporter DctM subunit